MLQNCEILNLQNWTVVLGLVASAAIFLNICIGIYRVTLHPLAGYPGPFLAKITDAYAGYHGWVGDVHLDAHRLHKKYGDFVRYGPNRLLVNSANGLRDIYGHGRNVQKSKAYLPMVPEKHAWSTLTTIDKHHHRFKRALISAQLKPQNLDEFEPTMQRYIEKLCSKLSEGSTSQTQSEPKNMAQWCEFFTIDVVGAFAFDQELGMLDSSQNHFIIDALHKYSGMMGVYLQIPDLAKFRFERILGLLTSWTKRQKAWKSWTNSFADQVLHTNPNGSRGVFSHIVQARSSEGKQLKTQELWAEGIFLFLAGFDTSATTLAALFFYLARYPQIYDRLKDEIRQKFPDPTKIGSGWTLSSCTYLNACITEALRISPATPGFPLREVLSSGIVVNGHHIPSGIDVGTCIYALHHNAEYFEDPDTFIPERWIKPGNRNNAEWEEQLARQLKAYCPFSIGPRSCPGRQFAMMEISLLLARVIATLTFQFAEDKVGGLVQGAATVGNNEYRLRAHVTSSGHGPFLSFRKRNQ